MMSHPSFLVLAILLLCSTTTFAQKDRSFEGYLKRDVKVFDDTEILRRGEAISCNVEADGKKCCYEDEPGRACISIDDISKVKVQKRDVAIASVLVNQSFSADKTACEAGVEPKDKSDAFVWSYGVRLRPGIDGRALIRVSHIARKGSLTYRLMNMTKTWSGLIDDKCHAFNFTKDDIRAYLDDYEKVGQFLDPSRDSNLDVEVWVEVLSEFEEESYKNNLIKIKTQLPADGAASWPPDSVGQPGKAQ